MQKFCYETSRIAMFIMLCRLNELIPRDCNQALSGVVRQLQRGIDEPEYIDGVMRPKRMVCHALAPVHTARTLTHKVFSLSILLGDLQDSALVCAAMQCQNRVCLLASNLIGYSPECM